nr:MAG TPA: hypothetical protein [Caudoviricetes sp.]
MINKNPHPALPTPGREGGQKLWSAICPSILSE